MFIIIPPLNKKSKPKLTYVYILLICALNSNLSNLKNWVGTYTDISIGAITLNEYGYQYVEEQIKAQIPNLQEIINVNIINWNGVTPPYNISAQGLYLSGEPNAYYNGIWLRVFYR